MSIIKTLALLVAFAACLAGATFLPQPVAASFAEDGRELRQAALVPHHHVPAPVLVGPQSRKEAASRMIHFTRRHNAVECLQRIICHLSYDGLYYGEEGLEFGKRLQVIESIVQESDIVPYRQARAFGLDNKDPANCKLRYPICAFQPGEIIRLGLRMMKRIPEE